MHLVSAQAHRLRHSSSVSPKCLASARGDVKHAWVVQLSGMVAGVYDQSVDGVVLSKAHLVALKLVNCCRPRNVLGFKTMRVISVLE